MPSTPARRLGEANKNLVLNEVRNRGVVSADELVRHTGRSQPTVLKWLNTLEQEGYLQRAGFGDSRGGRPPVLYRFHSEQGFVLGLALEIPAVKAALLDLSGRPMITKPLSVPLESPPDVVLEQLYNRLIDLAASAGIDRGRLVGAGVALSGFIDRDRGSWVATPRLPEWRNVSVGPFLEAGLGVPVVVNHHIDALTLAELSYGNVADWPDFVYFDLGYGLGVRLVQRGRLALGSFGNAGNIGHTTVVPGGRPCLCGNRGCLEEYVSGRALLREYPPNAGSNPFDDESTEEVDLQARKLFEARAAAKSEASRISEELIEYLSIGIANVINLFDLPRIVINGFVTEGGEEVLGELLERSRERLQPTLARATRIVFSSAPRPVAAPHGAALFALQHYLPFANPLVAPAREEGGERQAELSTALGR